MLLLRGLLLGLLLLPAVPESGATALRPRFQLPTSRPLTVYPRLLWWPYRRRHLARDDKKPAAAPDKKPPAEGAKPPPAEDKPVKSELLLKTLLEKAEWNVLFVKMMKLLLHYFLDLILQEYFGTKGR